MTKPADLQKVDSLGFGDNSGVGPIKSFTKELRFDYDSAKNSIISDMYGSTKLLLLSATILHAFRTLFHGFFRKSPSRPVLGVHLFLAYSS
jgi:hypothetical protein